MQSNFLLSLNLVIISTNSNIIDSNCYFLVDYREKFEEAKRWGESSFVHWKKRLTDSETAALKGYTEDYVDINSYLRATEGEIITADDKERYDELSERFDIDDINHKIIQIEKSLHKIVTPQTISVYRWTDASHFGLEADELISDQGDLNHEVVENIINNWTQETFTFDSFMSTSLVQKIPKSNFNPDNYPVLLKITLPKGTHAGYITKNIADNEEAEVLIQKGYTFRYTNFSLVPHITKFYLHANVTLI